MLDGNIFEIFGPWVATVVKTGTFTVVFAFVEILTWLNKLDKFCTILAFKVVVVIVVEGKVEVNGGVEVNWGVEVRGTLVELLEFLEFLIKWL